MGENERLGQPQSLNKCERYYNNNSTTAAEADIWDLVHMSASALNTPLFLLMVLRLWVYYYFHCTMGKSEA